jgi:hypothetical protein
MRCGLNLVALAGLTRLLRGTLHAAPLPPWFDLGRRNRRLAKHFPVERHVRILGFERVADGFVERLAADHHTRGSPEPVKDSGARCLSAPCGGINQVDVLVSALVS